MTFIAAGDSVTLHSTSTDGAVAVETDGVLMNALIGATGVELRVTDSRGTHNVWTPNQRVTKVVRND